MAVQKVLRSLEIPWRLVGEPFEKENNIIYIEQMRNFKSITSGESWKLPTICRSLIYKSSEGFHAKYKQKQG